MTDDDRKGFAELLAGALAFWGKQVTPFTLEVWWRALKPYDLHSIRRAFSVHAVDPEQGRFAPMPADIVRLIGGTHTDAALIAWSKVDRAVRHVGTWVDVVFDDPLIHRVIADMGGWTRFSTSTEDEWPFVAREFQTRYRGYAMKREVPEYPPVLAGHSTQINAITGHKSNPPALIGDSQKAAITMKQGTMFNLISVLRLTRIESERLLDGE